MGTYDDMLQQLGEMSADKVRVLRNAFPFNEQECLQMHQALRRVELNALADKMLAYIEEQNVAHAEREKALLDAGFKL